MEPIEFSARIEEGNRGGAFVTVPPLAVQKLGIKSRAKIVAIFDGKTEYRGSVVTMGGTLILGVLKEIRSSHGKEIGDMITVSLCLDTEERKVEIPEDFLEAMRVSGALECFERLPFTHKKEHVQAIMEAKKIETRQRRIEKSIEMILNKRKKI